MSQLRHIGEYLDAHLARLRSNQGRLYLDRPRTGIAQLDMLLDGFYDGNVIVVASRKDRDFDDGRLFLANLVRELTVNQGLRVGFFIDSCTGTQIAQQLLAIESQIPADRIRGGILTPRERERLMAAHARIAAAPAFVTSLKVINELDFADTCSKLQRDWGLEVLIVENLEMIRPTRAVPANERGDYVFRAIRLLSRDLSVPTIVGSRLPPGEKWWHEPRLDDITESIALGQDSDVVVLVYPPRPPLSFDDEDKPIEPVKRSRAELVRERVLIDVAKNRHGPRGTVLVELNRDIGTFEEFPELSGI